MCMNKADFRLRGMIALGHSRACKHFVERWMGVVLWALRIAPVSLSFLNAPLPTAAQLLLSMRRHMPKTWAR